MRRKSDGGKTTHLRQPTVDMLRSARCDGDADSSAGRGLVERMMMMKCTSCTCDARTVGT
eukprot:3531858-Pleurochrysis_carterae.AAC.1